MPETHKFTRNHSIWHPSGGTRDFHKGQKIDPITEILDPEIRKSLERSGVLEKLPDPKPKNPDPLLSQDPSDPVTPQKPDPVVPQKPDPVVPQKPDPVVAPQKSAEKAEVAVKPAETPVEPSTEDRVEESSSRPRGRPPANPAPADTKK